MTHFSLINLPEKFEHYEAIIQESLKFDINRLSKERDNSLPERKSFMAHQSNLSTHQKPPLMQPIHPKR